MQKILRLFFQFFLDFNGVTLDNGTFNNLQVIHVSKFSIHTNAIDVDIGELVTYDGTLCSIFF